MASLLLLRGYGEDQGPSIVQTPFAPAWSKGYYWILFLSTGFFAVNLALLIKSRLQY
jgi:hypothetical protein